MTPKLVEVNKTFNPHPHEPDAYRETENGEYIIISKDLFSEMQARSLAASDLLACGTDAIKERDEAREKMKRWLARVTEVELERDIARGELATSRQMLGRVRKAIARHKNMIYNGEDPYDANNALWRAYNGQGD